MRKCYNTYDLISSEFGIGFTNKGETFFFDKEDYPKIKDICWHKDTKTGYIRGHLPNRGGRTSLHRVVMDAVKGETIDHINYDLDDNRKSNLRKCSRSQNSSNLSTRTDNKTGFPGVRFDRQRQKWAVQICVNRKRIDLGRYELFEDAVEVRRNAEDRYFKEYSYENSKKISKCVKEDG